MKKKLIVSGMIFILLVYLVSFFKPSVTIHNNTDYVLYLYKSIGEKNVDPDAEEADEAMRAITIKRGESMQITLPLKGLQLANGQLYFGWSIGSRNESLAKGNGGIIFNITNNNGHCSFNMNIDNKGHNISPGARSFCLTSLSPEGL